MKEQCQKISKRPGMYNLPDIFSIIEVSYGSEKHLSLSNIYDCLSLLCGRDVINLDKKPCNFYCTIQ